MTLAKARIANESLSMLVIEDPYAQIATMAPVVEISETALVVGRMGGLLPGMCLNATKERGIITSSYHEGLGLDAIEEPEIFEYEEIWD